MRISDWSSDVCSSDLRAALGVSRRWHGPPARAAQRSSPAQLAGRSRRFNLTETGSRPGKPRGRSEEHTSELQSLMRISYAVFCLKKKKKSQRNKATNKITLIKNKCTH